MKIHFDVDGTLITFSEKPRNEVIDMLKFLHQTNEIVVWSRGGKEYAESWGVKLGLPADIKYFDKEEYLKKHDKPILNVDDEEFDIAKVTIKV